MSVTCKLCGKPIESVRMAWKEQVGWVSPHGSKSMTFAQRTGEVAHDTCITLLRAGVDPKQMELV